MSTPKEQYEAMLDEMPDECKLKLVEHVPFARLLEDIDPVAYRCGQNDFQPVCDDCGNEYWADDPDDEAICQDCRAKADAEDREFTTADEP